MFRLSRQKIDGVWQDRQNSLERAYGSGRATRQIQHKSLSQGPANRAAQDRHRGLAPAFCSHQFRYAIQESIAHRPGCLRSYVPGADAGSPCGNHQVRSSGGALDCVFDDPLFVRNYNVQHRLPTGSV